MKQYKYTLQLGAYLVLFAACNITDNSRETPMYIVSPSLERVIQNFSDSLKMDGIIHVVQTEYHNDTATYFMYFSKDYRLNHIEFVFFDELLTNSKKVVIGFASRNIESEFMNSFCSPQQRPGRIFDSVLSCRFYEDSLLWSCIIPPVSEYMRKDYKDSHSSN